MTKKMPRPMPTPPPHRVKVTTVPIGTGRCFPQDLPLAPGQEQFEDWFIFTLATCRVVNVARFEHWMRILRAYYHAEAWELVAHDIESDDDDTQWRRGEGVDARCNAESWRRKAEELAK